MLKCLTGAVIVIALMQIKIGRDTIEDHATDLIHESQIFVPVKAVAESAVAGIKQAWSWSKKQVQGGFDNTYQKSKAATQGAIDGLKKQLKKETGSSHPADEPDPD